MKTQTTTQTDHRNKYYAVAAKILVIREDDTVIYSFQDPMLWDPKTQNHTSLSTDPDKFSTIAEDFETAKSEFWFKWNTYSKRRFGYSVPLALTWIEHLLA